MSERHPRAPYRGVLVRGSATVATASTSEAARTIAVDLRDHVGVDWLLYLTDPGAITRLDMLMDYSEEESPDPAVATDWAQVQVENVVLATGVSDLTDYLPRFAVSGAKTYGLASPTRGRWMRLRVWVGAGTPTTSALSVVAFPRTA